MTAVAMPAGPVLGDVLKRAADPDEWERFERQLRSTGYCRQPVRLRGQVDAIDAATGEVVTVYSTDARARRDAAEVLRQPARGRLPVVRADLPRRRLPARRERDARRQGRARDGRRAPAGVPDADGAELRAGALASRRRRQGAALPAAPRRRGLPARRVARVQRRSTTRTTRASASRSARECFDYEHAVLWNALAPELWRRTRDPAPARARAPARRQRRSELPVRVSYVKVAEFQRRGALHFHCVLRLDGVDEDGELEAPAPELRRAAADRRRARGRAARVGALPRSRRRAGPAARLHARAGARDPLGRAGRGARARHARLGRGRGVVRGLHRQVRDQVHRGGRRADVPARGERPRRA